MASVAMKREFRASAEAVWKAVSDFNGLPRLVAGIVESTMKGSGVGAERTITFDDGTQLVERLESQDDAKRTLSYSIVQGEVPFTGYLSTMRVRDLGKGRCELSWSATFEPAGASEAEVKAMIQGVYSAGFAGLTKLFGG